MSRLLSRIFGHKAGTKRRSPQLKSVLRLESLEDRAVPATFTVNTFADVVANDGRLSLREAINQANALPGPDIIRLQAGLYKITRAGTGEDANARGDFDVKDSLTIVGLGAGATAIESNTPFPGI